MTDTIQSALLAAQSEMPTGINPAGNNPHFKSKYITLATLTAAVLPILHKHGLALTMSAPNGSMVATLHHEKGELSFAVPLGVKDANNAQAVGSAITYARRQLLGMISGIAPDEDDDGNKAVASAPKPEPTFEDEVASADLRDAALSRMDACGTVGELQKLGREIAGETKFTKDDLDIVRECWAKAKAAMVEKGEE